KHLVTLAGKEIHLTQIEFKIISLLAQNSGRVMTYDSIISSIWGPYADDDNSILRVNMAHIRRKLEQNPAEPQYIFTEIGIGYRMVEDEM
ncbi:MAG: winged helix-turn-helix domain-containing protein, partial [Lachnoclostridium sp.]|nr:winged helix-turn-helix domain-containing protein [Lachnoclostridium sp.]